MRTKILLTTIAILILGSSCASRTDHVEYEIPYTTPSK